MSVPRLLGFSASDTWCNIELLSIQDHGNLEPRCVALSITTFLVKRLMAQSYNNRSTDSL